MSTSITDPIATITDHGYEPTEADLAELGALSVGATKLSGTIGTTYIRTLVKRSQILVAGGVTGGLAASAAVAQAHSDFYPHILRGVTTPDVAPEGAVDRADSKRRSLERNSRSNFARTAYSTLRRWVAGGGQLLEVNPATVTKSWLADGARAQEAATEAAAVQATSGNAITDTSTPFGAQMERVYRKRAALENAIGRAVRMSAGNDFQRQNVRDYCDVLASDYAHLRDNI
jgi:hypothetical protein